MEQSTHDGGDAVLAAAIESIVNCDFPHITTGMGLEGVCRTTVIEGGNVALAASEMRGWQKNNIVSVTRKKKIK